MTQRRDKGRCESYAIRSVAQALWVQQARPQTVFNWQFWEKAAKDPKMTAYLNHGVKAKMCEATPFVNTAERTMLLAELT